MSAGAGALEWVPTQLHAFKFSQVEPLRFAVEPAPRVHNACCFGAGNKIDIPARAQLSCDGMFQAADEL